MACFIAQERAVHIRQGGEDAVGGLRVAGVVVTRTPGRAAVTVSLMHGDTVLSAQVERPAVDSGGMQVAAEAALEVVRQIAPSGTHWILLGTARQATSGGQAVVVQVLLETERGQEYLIGSALGRGGPLEEAAAHAVVDAVDRRLSGLRRT